MHGLNSRQKYITSTLERLLGIINGIVVDDELTDTEIAALSDWLDTHSSLFVVEPFRELKVLLERCLSDGVVESVERDEILEWCSCFVNSNPFPDGVTTAVRLLHGVLSGIGIDHKITDDEIAGLQDWLYNFESLKDDVYPFNDLFPLLERILDDGIITDEERSEFSCFCGMFTERVVKSPILHDEIYIESWMKTRSPIFEPLLNFCDHVHKIIFHGRTFCFTGPAVYGKRSELHALVEKCGGVSRDRVVKELDYLIIGAQSSPYWVYSTYGRKIESVIERNKARNSETVIIHEDAFVDQARVFLESV